MKNWIFFLSALCFTLCAGSACAVDIDPPRIELAVSYQQTPEGDLTITNQSPRTVEVKIKTDGYRYFQAGPALPSCRDWLKFDLPSFMLGAGASTRVHYRVDFPENIAQDTAAEYVAAILVDQLPVENASNLPYPKPEIPAPSALSAAKNVSGPIAGEIPAGGSAGPRAALSESEEELEPATQKTGPVKASGKITIVPRIALPVYIQIKERSQVHVDLEEVSMKKAQEMAVGPSGEPAPELIRFDVRLSNSGTVHIRPAGNYAVFKEDGSLLRSGSLGKSLPILPGSKLTVPMLMPIPPQGKYRTVVTIDTEQEKLLQKDLFFEVSAIGELTELKEPPKKPEPNS